MGVSENRAISYKNYRQNHVSYAKQKREKSIFLSNIMILFSPLQDWVFQSSIIITAVMMPKLII